MKKNFFPQIAEAKITSLGKEREFEAWEAPFLQRPFLLWEPMYLDALPFLMDTHLTAYGVDKLITVSDLSSRTQFIKLACGTRVEMGKAVTAVWVYFTAWAQRH